jgi:hypothetical protein
MTTFTVGQNITVEWDYTSQVGQEAVKHFEVDFLTITSVAKAVQVASNERKYVVTGGLPAGDYLLYMSAVGVAGGQSPQIGPIQFTVKAATPGPGTVPMASPTNMRIS